MGGFKGSTQGGAATQSVHKTEAVHAFIYRYQSRLLLLLLHQPVVLCVFKIDTRNLRVRRDARVHWHHIIGTSYHTGAVVSNSESPIQRVPACCQCFIIQPSPSTYCCVSVYTSVGTSTVRRKLCCSLYLVS